jgi:glutathionyl-hydroquinone reductase
LQTSIEEADMGLLVEGQWRDVWYDTRSAHGRFLRKDAAFRNWIAADGSAGPSGMGGFKAEAGRYISMSALPVHGRTAR